ncbi:MAG: plasmid mobilization relaxosome protein MobC [Gammaproteobacteria bacterium]
MNVEADAGLSKAFGKASTSKASQPRKRRKRAAPFSLRLTPDERARLSREAGETRWRPTSSSGCFNNLPDLASLRPALPGGRPATDTVLIAKLLAALGEARLANNLNQLARHANMGTLDISKATENELLAACAEVHAMRADLIAALGLKA